VARVSKKFTEQVCSKIQIVFYWNSDICDAKTNDCW